MRRIILDTDIGSNVDDALCLALASRSPEIDLIAVTCVSHEVTLRARIAAKQLALAGRSDVPVYAGCRVPLQHGNGFRWFGHESEGVIEPTEEPPIGDGHAVDVLRRLLHERDDLEIVAIGPLTNLATALILEPDLAARIRGLTLMGGHLRKAEYGGHVFGPGIDYNLCSDPHAAWVVLRAGLPVRLVTIDVTLSTWMTRAELAAIEGCASPLQRVLADSIRIWTPVQKRKLRAAGCDVDDDNVAFLHDPLALACVYDPSFCVFEELAIETRIEAGILRTLESVDTNAETFPMHCAVGVDANRFRAHLLERITAG